MELASYLIGKTLVRQLHSEAKRIIVETEAYAARGPPATPSEARPEAISRCFSVPGYCYVILLWLFVHGERHQRGTGRRAGVLLRALELSKALRQCSAFARRRVLAILRAGLDASPKPCRSTTI